MYQFGLPSALLHASSTSQCLFDTLIRQPIGTLIARVARMAFDPAPVNGVSATFHQFIESLPQVDVLDRLLGGCFPAFGLPARQPTP